VYKQRSYFSVDSVSCWLQRNWMNFVILKIISGNKLCFQKCFTLNVSFYEWFLWFCFNCSDLFRVGLPPLIFWNPTQNRKFVGWLWKMVDSESNSCNSVQESFSYMTRNHSLFGGFSHTNDVSERESTQFSTECSLYSMPHDKQQIKLAWHCNQAINRNKIPVLPLQCQCKDLRCKLILLNHICKSHAMTWLRNCVTWFTCWSEVTCHIAIKMGPVMVNVGGKVWRNCCTMQHHMYWKKSPWFY